MLSAWILIIYGFLPLNAPGNKCVPTCLCRLNSPLGPTRCCSFKPFLLSLCLGPALRGTRHVRPEFVDCPGSHRLDSLLVALKFPVLSGTQDSPRGGGWHRKHGPAHYLNLLLQRITYLHEESKMIYESKDGKAEKVFNAVEWLAP